MSGEVTVAWAGQTLGMSREQVIALLRDGALVHRRGRKSWLTLTPSATSRHRSGTVAGQRCSDLACPARRYSAGAKL